MKTSFKYYVWNIVIEFYHEFVACKIAKMGATELETSHYQVKYNNIGLS